MAARLRGDETIALIGELGAGKTILTQGLASGLNIKGRVASPTFVIERVYKVPGKTWRLHHADLYRVRGDIAEAGIEEAMGSNVVVIEWAGFAADALPDDGIEITMNILDNQHRKITLHVPDNRTYLIDGLGKK